MGDSDPPDEFPKPVGVPGPVASQAAFDAAWDLRTQWRQKQRIPAADYGNRIGAAVFALPEVQYALAAAEQHARCEAGELVSAVDLGSLRTALPGRSGVYLRLLELFGSGLGGLPVGSTVPAPQYPYLSPPTAPGELGHLGSYRVIREVGRGGRGVVFEAEDEDTIVEPRQRALKVLEPGTSTPDSQARFLVEAQTVHNLPQHPNLVRVHNAVKLSGVMCIVMEYIYGPTLHDLIGFHLGGPIQVPLAVDLVRQAALGLAAVHRSHFVHRDVKPSNILLEWVVKDMAAGDPAYPFDWRARVCDFGFAVGAGHERLTREGYVPGTLLYLSPEQLESSSGCVWSESDVFALGVIAYELMAGRHPFQADTIAATIGKILTGICAPPQSANGEIPDMLDRLILQMLKPSPGERPSAEEVATTLSGLLGLEETSVKTQCNALAGPHVGATAEASRPELSSSGKAGGQFRPPDPPVVAPLTLDLVVTVYKAEDTKRGLSIDDPRVVPLRAGDCIRLEVRLTPPAYVYLVQLEANGDVIPLYPWQDPGNWDLRVTESPCDYLNFPPGQVAEMAPLSDGVSGIEAFVVLVRESPLEVAEITRLERVFKTSPQQGKIDPLRGVVWIGSSHDQFYHDTDRARVNLDAARQVEDPVDRLRQVLRSDEVRRLCRVNSGVCYPFAGGLM